MRTLVFGAVASFALGACSDSSPVEATPEAPATAETSPTTNRVELPPTVRQNLGITFATVAIRPVERTLRLPGVFELLPEARREYHAMLAGRLELLVSQYQRVAVGTSLYKLHSPAWHAFQREISGAEEEVRLTQATLTSIGPLRRARQDHEQSLRSTVELWQERIERLVELRTAGGGRADEAVQARASLAAAQAALAEVLEKDAELDAREAQATGQLASARSTFDLLIASASTLLDIEAVKLRAPSGDIDGDAPPLWRTIDVLEVTASAPGIVHRLIATNGAWLEAAAPVLGTMRPELIRFRAAALQSDLGRLRDGLAATLVPVRGGERGAESQVRGSLALDPLADPERRTLDLIVTPEGSAAWARAGMSAFAEVVLDGGAAGELAVPLAAVALDGLTSIIFRRDPRDPDKVIRLEADLGANDGSWVVVKSGLREGDEVVLDGVYQLMVATSGSIAKGGHFHADGSFHEGNQ